MSPLRVLITRPQPQADELVSLLANQQIYSLAQPLFMINNTTHCEQLKQLFKCRIEGKKSIVIFVSAAAVEGAEQTLPIRQWPIDQFIVVGQKTQTTLSKYTQGRIISAWPENSEGLLQLPELQQIKHQHFIIIRGDGGRELIAETLKARGAQVDYYETYQRQWINYSQSDTLDQWKKRQINCIVVTSNALLENMAQRLLNQGEFWQNECLWIVVSERGAEQAKTLGLKKVLNAKSAKNEILSQLISNYGKEHD